MVVFALTCWLPNKKKWLFFLSEPIEANNVIITVLSQLNLKCRETMATHFVHLHPSINWVSSQVKFQSYVWYLTFQSLHFCKMLYFCSEFCNSAQKEFSCFRQLNFKNVSFLFIFVMHVNSISNTRTVSIIRFCEIKAKSFSIQMWSDDPLLFGMVASAFLFVDRDVNKGEAQTEVRGQITITVSFHIINRKRGP